MSYSVLWVPAAEQELVELWMDPSHRRAITEAANEIDARLRIAPEDQGESRAHRRRILLVPPLGVTFEVLSDDRVVRVLDVWRFPEHG